MPILECATRSSRRRRDFFLWPGALELVGALEFGIMNILEMTTTISGDDLFSSAP
jgi:hypothetical protein